MSTEFQIKNMVCDRCKMVVQESFEKTGFQVIRADLGEIEVVNNFPPNQITQISDLLYLYGFELLENKDELIIEKIKNTIVELIHYQHEGLKMNFSDYLSEKLNRDYCSLSTLFSTHEGTTIEQYMIRQKIERVKELLSYDAQSLSQIADHLHYSSVAHLSNQFKKVTGLSPSQYKQSSVVKRLSLDRI